MLRPTLAMLRSSGLPGILGICANDISALAQLVNEAQMRLMMDPMAPDEGWWGGWARMAFTVSFSGNYAYVTAPPNVARLIVAGVNETPVRIRNGFYEFLSFTSGLQPKTNPCYGTPNGESSKATQIFERDSVVTLADQTITPATLRFYPSDSADLGKRILVQGADSNGMTIYGVDLQTKQPILGEYIYLDSPFTDTTNQFSRITGFIKDVTLGPVTIFQVDGSGNQYPLSAMEPGEVTAQYRRYLLNNILSLSNCRTPGQVQITAQAKLDFVPVQSDPDYLTITSIPALIEECQAIRYSRMDAPKAAELEQKHHLKALSLLFGQLDHYLGKTNVSVGIPIFGSDRPRLQPK